MKMLPSGLPESVLKCVESRLSEDVVLSGKTGVQKLVESCYAETGQGGSILQSANRFLLRIWDKVRSGAR